MTFKRWKYRNDAVLMGCLGAALATTVLAQAGGGNPTLNPTCVATQVCGDKTIVHNIYDGCPVGWGCCQRGGCEPFAWALAFCCPPPGGGGGGGEH